MEKKMNNKGFSLVELIIVVAIMAVLIGVLAPAYLQYVEKSKKTADCDALAAAMNAMEICAADPALDWTNQAITATVSSTGVAFTGAPTDTGTQLSAIIASGQGELQGSWSASNFAVTGTKTTTGTVTFTADSGLIGEIEDISPALAKRMTAGSTGGSTGGTTTP